MSAGNHRVLWITTSATWDGPGRALAALLRHWPADDAIAVVALRGADTAFREAVSGRATVDALGMRSVADFPAVRRLIAFARLWQPDIVHTQLSRADWIGRLVARRLGVPAVSTIQNVHSRMYAAEFSPLTSRVALALDRITGSMAARLIAVSGGVRDDLVRNGLRRDRIVVIANPFDPSRSAEPDARAAGRRRLDLADHHVACGTVALLKAQKGVRDLVDAAKVVVSQNPDVRFVHVGGGPLEADVRRWIADAGIADRFRLVGWVADPLSLLPAMDVFVLPSLWEGLPIALLEAMAAGLPAVGTRVAGIEEVIVDGVTGRLVPVHDPLALAAGITELACDPELRRAMGAAGGRRLEAFDARRIAKATRDVHVEVMTGKVLGTPSVL